MDKTLATILIARYLYAHGSTFLSDAEYDDCCREIQSKGVTLNPIYEDDPVPYEAFEQVLGYSKVETDEYLAKVLGIKEETSTSYFSDMDFLAESESLSIRSVTEYQDAFIWFQDKQNIDIVISTKIDGINTRRGYIRQGNALKFNAALTRGRRADPIDITTNIRRISPDAIDIPNADNLLIYSETIVPRSAIQFINDKYNTDYTIPRNLAMALMRVDKFDSEDFTQLKSFVFRVDYGSTLSEGIDLAASLGFDVVPYLHYTYRGETFSEFKDQMESCIHMLKEKTDAMGIITDGMVAEINDRTAFSTGTISNNYSSANLALKIGLWQPGVYESEVVSLDLSQHSDQCSCVAIVKPILAKGGQKISRVNCFNPSILFKYDIRPGKTIRFEYKNETTVDIILN